MYLYVEIGQLSHRSFLLKATESRERERKCRAQGKWDIEEAKSRQKYCTHRNSEFALVS